MCVRLQFAYDREAEVLERSRRRIVLAANQLLFAVAHKSFCAGSDLGPVDADLAQLMVRKAIEDAFHARALESDDTFPTRLEQSRSKRERVPSGQRLAVVVLQIGHVAS